MTKDLRIYFKYLLYVLFICFFPYFFKSIYVATFSFEFLEKSLFFLLISTILYQIFDGNSITNFKTTANKLLTDDFVIFFLLFLAFLINFTCLFEKWASGTLTSHSVNAIGAILPFKDADGVVSGCKDLIEFGHLNSATSRRPITALVYSFLLSTTNQNLIYTLMIMATLVSTTIFFVARILYQYFGIIASIISILLLSYFYLPFNGTTLTEPVGLLYGNCSLALLLIAIYNKNTSFFLLGISILTLGISARAGAFFCIPFIILFAIFFFRKQDTLLNYKFGLLSLLCVFITFSIPPILLSIVGSPEGYDYQGNFSYKLYGMVVGGEDWAFVLEKHPEISDLPLEDRAEYIYELTKQAFYNKPFGILQSIFKDFLFILTNPFSFLWNFKSQFLFNKYLLLLPSTFFFVQFYNYKPTPKTNVALFLIFSLMGIICSYPFVSDSGGYRVFAATVPTNFAIIAIGTSLLTIKIKEYVATINK